MSFLSVSGISKKQGENLILKDVSFNLDAFQKIAIAGETGCGKSTLLKIIAGYVQPDAGEVRFEDKKVAGPNDKLLPGHKGIAYLSQHFELRNNYRIEEELSYTNQLSDAAAFDVYEVCRIDHLLKRKTNEVSGGEKQRIAMARQLISSPKLFLLDEPYSNLDMIHKSILKNVISDIGERLQITCLLVSHEPADTLSWADKIMVMKGGQLVQQGSPQQVYYHPENEYVAGLLGKYNRMSEALQQAFAALKEEELHEPEPIIRPERFKLSLNESGGLKGEVKEVIFLGSHYEAAVLLLNELITAKTEAGLLQKGDEVFVSLQ